MLLFKVLPCYFCLNLVPSSTPGGGGWMGRFHYHNNVLLSELGNICLHFYVSDVS